MRNLVQALIRILAIFFSVKSIDTAAGGTYNLIMQSHILPGEVTRNMPNIWLTILPVIIFYLLLSFGLFIIAPFLSRIIIPEKQDTELNSGSLDLAVITSSALLITAWAFIRLVDHFHYYIDIIIAEEEFRLPASSVFFILCNLALLLVSILMIKKMPILLKILKSKSANKM